MKALLFFVDIYKFFSKCTLSSESINEYTTQNIIRDNSDRMMLATALFLSSLDSGCDHAYQNDGIVSQGETL